MSQIEGSNAYGRMAERSISLAHSPRFYKKKEYAENTHAHTTTIRHCRKKKPIHFGSCTTMFEEKHLHKQYKAEAVCTVYLLNNSSTDGASINPHQAYFGHIPNMAHLRIFGTIAYVSIPDEKRNKLDPKS